jgi:Protein kinase domain
MTEQSIFLAALAWADPARRAAFLDTACAGDPALRRRVEALLQAHAGDSRALSEWPGGASSAGGAGEMTRGGDETPGGEPVGLGFLEPSNNPESLGRLAHYEVLQVLGRGGFGVVLKAFDQKLHRAVALKVLAPYLAASGTARQRFLREARAAAAVRHEHVVDIHAVEDTPAPYLVMEFVAGQTLQRKLDRTGPLALREILRVGAQIARGLAAAHARGLVHRDIKPANVLLEDGSERVKITDFGLARAADDGSLTQSGYVAGTPLYMAPEQAMGEVVDHRADLFSLGSTLYALCTGRPPFRAGTALGILKRVIEDEPRPIREVNPAIPSWLCDVVARLQAKRPADRFASADEVADLLEKHLTEAEADGIVTTARPPAAPLLVAADEEKKPAPAAWSRRRNRWLIIATVAAALVAGLALTEAAGIVPVARTVARLFASSGPAAVAGDNRDGPGQIPVAVAPPQAAPDRKDPPRPIDVIPAPLEPPPAVPLPPPVVTVKERKECDLPEPFEDVKAGAGGRLLIFYMKKAKTLAVFDVCRAEVVHEIPLHAEDVRYAAGRDKLLVVLPSQRVIERWDLRTFRLEETVPVPDGGNVETAVMGCDSSGPLALWAGDKMILMDVGLMSPLDIEGMDLGGRAQKEGFEVRVSADGQTFIGWGPKFTQTKFKLRWLTGRKATQAVADDGTYKDRWAMPSADGSLILRYDHQATDAGFKPYLDSWLSDRVLLPTADPRFFLAARDQEVTVCTSCDRQGVVAIHDNALQGMASDPVYTHWFLVKHAEPRVHYLPDAHLFVFLPEGNRQVVVRPFNLTDELEKAGQDYLYVTSLPRTRVRPGAQYTYRMDVKSKPGGLEFKLGTAPQGMTVSDEGELRWDVPPGEAGRSRDVIVNVSNAARKEVVHAFKIVVE